jgi:hypothetical protein
MNGPKIDTEALAAGIAAERAQRAEARLTPADVALARSGLNRDQLAAMAMQGILAGTDIVYGGRVRRLDETYANAVVENAYLIADAMIFKRAKIRTGEIP